MTRREERKLVEAIRDSATKYLDAKNHAERYIYSREFGNAVLAFTAAAQEVVAS